MKQKPALGITLPLKLGSNGYFEQAFDALTQIRSNLINLLLTKKGERLMQPSFGCDIHQYVFSNITSNTEANVRGAIEEAVQTWMPFVKIEQVKVQTDPDYNKILVSVIFTIPNNLNIADTITLVF